ncbi:MAG: hypothetical protein KDJ22_13805 [Candidatus Competibacteraceae bacterium]|nr:hypothetical protein [Candidatus Competibacteraceae bacterium]MCB1771223.1 hypothetical protein [Candidatus Competibacteraceae bacterium]MCB1820577.1 hypothetical protein [Candidatus Competibacteraceae bacterium]
MIILHHQSVVVLGVMNPAIHHPAWYQAMSIITEAEFEESLRNQVIVTPQLTQFKTENLVLDCTLERWQVSSEAEEVNRIMTLAKTTFEKLYHTPIKAYGVNHNFHIETKREIAPTLMSIIRKTDLPFPPHEEGTATITYIAEGDDCKFRTVISISPRGQNFLHIQNNVHFDVSSEEKGHFDLGPLLDRAFQINEKRSQRMRLSITNAIEGC